MTDRFDVSDRLEGVVVGDVEARLPDVDTLNKAREIAERVREDRQDQELSDLASAVTALADTVSALQALVQDWPSGSRPRSRRPTPRPRPARRWPHSRPRSRSSGRPSAAPRRISTASTHPSRTRMPRPRAAVRSGDAASAARYTSLRCHPTLLVRERIPSSIAAE